MSCKKLAIFSGLLLSFAFSSLLVSSSYATSVDCSIDKNTSFSNSPISNRYPLSDVCLNFSSLDSSKDWFFILNINFLKDFASQVQIYAWGQDIVESGQSYSSRLYPNFHLIDFSVGYNPSVTSNTFVISTSNVIKPHSISISNKYLRDGFFTMSLSITDEKPSFSSVSPTGNIDITSNGTFDVTQYASATVNVPQEISETPYDNKLDQIIKAIYVCSGTMLVIYFFYCIYRMLIKRGGT